MNIPEATVQALEYFRVFAYPPEAMDQKYQALKREIEDWESELILNKDKAGLLFVALVFYTNSADKDNINRLEGIRDKLEKFLRNYV